MTNCFFFFLQKTQGDRGYWNAGESRDWGTSIWLIYPPLISTFHPKRQWKEEALSSHGAPSPLPRLSALTQLCLALSLNLSPSFISLSFHHQLSSGSRPPLSSPDVPLHPSLSPWSFIQLPCWCLWFSGDMCRVCVLQLCKVTDCCFFSLPPPPPGHMVVPKGKSELSTRTHPQTARAPSEMELDNRSSSKPLVFEEELGK